jgi:DNA mismatch endonuclease, patch repair protein
MPDVFTKRKRSEVMSRIRGRGNKDTEIALAKLLRAEGITGWRRQMKVRIEGGKGTNPPRGGTRPTTAERRLRRERPTRVRVDFVFRKERVVVFVDGCFWHGCPIHSSPRKWLRKSSMGGGANSKSAAKMAALQFAGRGRRTGKAFWASKMAGNIARDKFVTRKLRRDGWRVVRLWVHDLVKNPVRCVRRVRKAMMR